MELRDLLSRSRGQWSVAPSANEMILDIAHLSYGTYALSLLHGGAVQTKLVVKH